MASPTSPGGPGLGGGTGTGTSPPASQARIRQVIHVVTKDTPGNPVMGRNYSSPNSLGEKGGAPMTD